MAQSGDDYKVRNPQSSSVSPTYEGVFSMLAHNDDAYAAMLLTLRLSKDSAIAPLSPREYHHLCRKVSSPGRLMNLDVYSVSQLLTSSEDEAYRVASLLSRSVPLAVLLEKCQGAGIELIVQGEAAYPPLLAQRMGLEAPPVLFACGKLGLLEEKGAAVLGISARRDFSADAAALAARAAENGMALYADGGEGLGLSCQRAVHETGGKLVAFLADPMQERIFDPTLSEMIATGRALALSAREPDAPFDRKRARERSLCLCSLADFSALFCLERREGPLWDAASAALASRGMPRLYARAEDGLEGNAALLKKGAFPFHDVSELPFSRPNDGEPCQLSFLF